MTMDDAGEVVLRMQECFNTRQFDQADDLHTPDCFSHVLGATGFQAGKSAWRSLVAQFPGIRVVAEDVLVDRNKVAVRSSIEGIPVADDGPRPMMMEIFRIDNGRIAESWAVGQGLPYSVDTLASAPADG
ncbi:SnoaL-like polyketide cyclase [Nocardia tenerifensis]|uniref:SnoaL-like polyketide cyclase n=1 Tax=Nocardia tenerifensis TaxID=228006 RepID=A0A318KAC7_9NOCA|nr:ester cyclase [Nocardia tenerifensis]PXX70837.1 SnoaL-like polyketide cyclase [Nocardia tenerifensis]